jgi:vitamin-K-epoxide reductase (warfarin-sensitive)
MVLGIQITAVVGFLLSIYAKHIENKTKENENFKAVCDISEAATCGKVIGSKYNKTFGVSNSIGGMIFYIVVFLLTLFAPQYIFYLAVLSILGMLYLAYIQYFVLKNFCLVCTAIYAVNILLAVLSYRLI